MRLTYEIEREDDGRWIVEILELPGVMSYGPTQEQALASAQALALRAIADRIEHGEQATAIESVQFVRAA
jgi:predicted RNase H-like HicB family nuclease